jgi:hypothetical protein
MTKLDKSFDLDRDPSSYHKTRHYRRRVSDRVMVEDDVVEEAISEGDVTELSPDRDYDDGSQRAVFRLEQRFLTLEVVVNVENRQVKTAYEVES